MNLLDALKQWESSAYQPLAQPERAWKVDVLALRAALYPFTKPPSKPTEQTRSHAGPLYGPDDKPIVKEGAL